MYITLRESHRGLSKSSNYYFIIEGSRLVHISHYAASERKIYGDTVEYIVDLEKLYNKSVAEVVATNSGIICNVFVYLAKDLSLDYSQRKPELQPLSYLNKFEFTHLTSEERKFVQEDWKRYYILMLEELRKFFITIIRSFNPVPIYLPNLVACQIESYADYPLSFLIPYSKDARRKSLEGLTKEIHQLWVSVRIIIEIARLGLLTDLKLNFGQSSYNAVASFRCKDKICSMWYEFDMNPHTMCEGMLWNRGVSKMLREFYERAEKVWRVMGLNRLPLRPDIVILRGGRNCEDLVNDFEVVAIIECKNWDYEYWFKDVDSQIIPYKEIFQPDALIIASLKKVPTHVKTRLAKLGITVIDEVYPRGRGEEELLQFIRAIVKG